MLLSYLINRFTDCAPVLGGDCSVAALLPGN